MKTNKDRIEKDIMALGAISCVEGIGCTRYTYTDEFAKARDYIMAEMEAAATFPKNGQTSRIFRTRSRSFTRL